MGVSRQMQSKFSSEFSNFQEHLFTEHLWTTVFILSVPLRAVGSFFMVGGGGAWVKIGATMVGQRQKMKKNTS